MNVNDGPAASRQFEAHSPFWGSKVASKTTPAWQNNPTKSYAIMVAGVLVFSVVLGGLYMGVQSLAEDSSEGMQYFAGRGFQYLLVALLFAGVYGWYWWSRRTMVGRRSGLDVSPPAPGQPARCLLFPNSLLIQEMGAFAVRKKREFLASANQPRLVIDVGVDGIRVIDPNTNALIAAVSTAQVTATPVIYRPVQGHHLLPNLGHAISDAATNYWSTSPGMRVSIPGMAPLTIGCRDSVSGLDFRFSWPDDVPTEAARADYEVSGTDWLTLVEKVGLAPYLNKRG